LNHAGYVGFVFGAPLVIAALLEAAITLVSDALDRRRLVVLGQAALAAALFFVSWTTSPWGLAAGLALAGAASGVACSAAQALLVASSPEGADRAMVRWTLFAAVGDLVAPLVTAAVIAYGGTYRGATFVVASIVAMQAIATALAPSRPFDDARGDDDDERPDPVLLALRRALRRPRLWTWLFAASMCTLLDELVVAFGALRLARAGALDAAAATAAAVAFSAGATLGAALTDRAVARVGSRRVLLASAALCAFAVAALVLAPSTPPALFCAALFSAGITCAPHHALAQARAYDELPKNPGTVQAMGQLFVVIDVVAPIALGLVADRWGLGAALACLALQPAVIVACAVRDRDRA
jgi:MFS family permease